MTTDLFVKSFSNDYEWLKYCLRSIQRFATGFRRVVVVVPQGEKPPTGTAEVVFHVAEYGEPYDFQQVIKMHADHFTDAEFICVTDSDTIFTRPVRPEDFIADQRRVRWLYTPYVSLSGDDSQTWKKVTEKFIGHEVGFEFMRRQPFTIPRWALQELRAWCHKVHGVTLERYIMTQPNREVSEFNFLGAYLWFYHRDKVEWQNTDEEMGTVFTHQSYSWGGFNPDLVKHLEAALA